MNIWLTLVSYSFSDINMFPNIDPIFLLPDVEWEFLVGWPPPQNVGSQNQSGTFCYGHIIAIQMGKMGKHILIMMDIMFPLYYDVPSDITY